MAGIVTLSPMPSHATCHVRCLLRHPLPTLSVMSLLSTLCAVLLIAHAMCCTTHPLCRVALPVVRAVCRAAHCLCCLTPPAVPCVAWPITCAMYRAGHQ